MNWEQIYTEHCPAMIELAARRTTDRSDVDAADLVHEAFVAVLSDPPAHEPNWPDLLTARMAESCVRATDPVVDEQPIEDAADVAVRRLAAGEVRQRILRVMGYMTERQREITRLRLFEGLSVGEIAARMNTSSSNVSQIVIRCLSKLAPSLTQFDTFDQRDLERVRPPRRLN
ncbi:sigma-70 family RNA polymerase sigma factor [Actinophytocola sediminis]